MAKRAVRVFLDSNVILSGLISDKGPPRLILDILTLGLPFLAGLTGRFNLIEIERNLKKKAPGALSVLNSYLPKLNLTVIPLPDPDEVRRFSGKVEQKDIPVLLSALQGKADFLVTGDKKHFDGIKAKHTYPLRIVSPAEFLEIVLPDIIKSTDH